MFSGSAFSPPLGSQNGTGMKDRQSNHETASKNECTWRQRRGTCVIHAVLNRECVCALAFCAVYALDCRMLAREIVCFNCA